MLIIYSGLYMPRNSLNADYQQAFYDVIRNAVDEFPRTLALRVDLRFPTTISMVIRTKRLLVLLNH
jgi:hypothetical protein